MHARNLSAPTKRSAQSIVTHLIVGKLMRRVMSASTSDGVLGPSPRLCRGARPGPGYRGAGRGDPRRGVRPRGHYGRDSRSWFFGHWSRVHLSLRFRGKSSSTLRADSEVPFRASLFTGKRFRKGCSYGSSEENDCSRALSKTRANVLIRVKPPSEAEDEGEEMQTQAHEQSPSLASTTLRGAPPRRR